MDSFSHTGKDILSRYMESMFEENPEVVLFAKYGDTHIETYSGMNKCMNKTFQDTIKLLFRRLEEKKANLVNKIERYQDMFHHSLVMDKVIIVPHEKIHSGKNLQQVFDKWCDWKQMLTYTPKKMIEVKEILKFSMVEELSHGEIQSLLTMALGIKTCQRNLDHTTYSLHEFLDFLDDYLMDNVSVISIDYHREQVMSSLEMLSELYEGMFHLRFCYMEAHHLSAKQKAGKKDQIDIKGGATDMERGVTQQPSYPQELKMAEQHDSTTERLIYHLRAVFDEYTDQLITMPDEKSDNPKDLDPNVDESYRTQINAVYQEVEDQKVRVAKTLACYEDWVKDSLVEEDVILVPQDTHCSGKNLLTLKQDVEAGMNKWPQKPGKFEKLKESMKMAWVHNLSHTEIISFLTMMFDHGSSSKYVTIYTFLWNLNEFIGHTPIRIENVDHLSSSIIQNLSQALDLATKQRVLEYYHSEEVIRAKEISNQRTQDSRQEDAMEMAKTPTHKVDPNSEDSQTEEVDTEYLEQRQKQGKTQTNGKDSVNSGTQTTQNNHGGQHR